jgi:hypothetical protein
MASDIKTEIISIENKSNYHPTCGMVLAYVQNVTSTAKDYGCALTISGKQKTQLPIAVSTAEFIQVQVLKGQQFFILNEGYLLNQNLLSTGK